MNNRNKELKVCPMCGSPARIDSTGTAECYGWGWQTLTVECTDIMGKHCGMNIDIHADHYYFNQSYDKIIKLWNDLSEKNN